VCSDIDVLFCCLPYMLPVEQIPRTIGVGVVGQMGEGGGGYRCAILQGILP